MDDDPKKPSRENKIKSLDGRETRSDLSGHDSKGVSTGDNEDDELDLLKNIRLHRVTTSFGVTTRFGFSVGDLTTVLQLANQIRRQCIDAPEQFKALSDE